MSRVYITVQGDMLDNIAFKFYDNEDKAIFILENNPGLVDQPELLPQGLEIVIADLPLDKEKNTVLDVWG